MPWITDEPSQQHLGTGRMHSMKSNVGHLVESNVAYAAGVTAGEKY